MKRLLRVVPPSPSPLPVQVAADVGFKIALHHEQMREPEEALAAYQARRPPPCHPPSLSPTPTPTLARISKHARPSFARLMSITS